MINRKYPCSTEALKAWLQIAKKNKTVSTLYKIDNILKNTSGYEQEGITKLIEQWSRHDDFKCRIPEELYTLKIRFMQVSLKKSNTIDFYMNANDTNH